MKKILFAVFCIILIVALPIVSAELLNPYLNPAGSSNFGSNLGGFVNQDPFGDSLRRSTIGYSEPINLGSTIQINVADYQPKQVRQSYMEQSNVPVFMYLKGSTLGSTLSLFSGDPSQTDPFSGITNIPKIISIDVSMNESSEGYNLLAGAPRYFSPTSDRGFFYNMGGLVVF